MVVLVNPQPANPAQGGEFSITASDGIPPYVFKWCVDEGNVHSVTPEGDTITIDIPADTQGSILFISVTDAENNDDNRTWIITVKEKEW
jgi:hypothetical protein